MACGREPADIEMSKSPPAKVGGLFSCPCRYGSGVAISLFFDCRVVVLVITLMAGCAGWVHWMYEMLFLKIERPFY
jgi:hypothetical protein